MHTYMLSVVEISIFMIISSQKFIFYDENFGFIIDKRRPPATLHIYDEHCHKTVMKSTSFIIDHSHDSSVMISLRIVTNNI